MWHSDMTKVPVAALVPNGSGGYTTIAGTGSSDGSFTIPNVPAGTYLLQINSTNFTVTQTSTPDLGYTFLGRPQNSVATAGTTISASVTNANPAQTYDAFEMFVSNSNGYGLWLDPLQYGAMSEATSFTLNLPWTSYLTDFAQADQAVLADLTGQQAGPFWVHVLTRASGPLAFQQTSGLAAPVTSPLMDMPLTGTLDLAFKGSSFAPLLAGLNPHASPAGTFLYFDVDPADPSLGHPGNTPDLVMYHNGNGPLTTDVDFGDISYGNPYPSSWTPIVIVHDDVVYTYPVAGTTGFQSEVKLEVLTTNLPSAANPLVPLVGPVSNPTINGVSFFTDQSGVGTTPTISWNRPEFGTANRYLLTIYRMYANGTTATEDMVAQFCTTGTSLILPENLLMQGNSYHMDLGAFYNPAYDASISPFRLSMPSGNATSASGLITP
jgi:hypothetical protein